MTWHEADSPRSLDVSLASLDNPEAAEPTVHLWTENRIGWFDADDQLPRYPTNDRPKPVS